MTPPFFGRNGDHLSYISATNNCESPLAWTRIHKYGEVELGTVELPGAYGCAWIIDGQHRLYGAASARTDVLLPVVAFEGVSEEQQARLFVVINKQQTSVAGNLLWDLYSDIYRDSEDEREKKLRHISDTAKILASSGPLSARIKIESMPQTGNAPLTLTTVCSTINRYCRWDLLSDTSDQERTPSRAAHIIGAYYEALRELWPRDFRDPRTSVLLSNNGFGVFMMVFNDILVDLVARESDTLFAGPKRRELVATFVEYLRPAVEYARQPGVPKDIKGQTGRGPQNENAQLLDLKIQEWRPSFAPARLPANASATRVSAPPPAVDLVKRLAAETETVLREFILSKLKEGHGRAWWKRGIPGGAKGRLDRTWQQDVQRNPHLRSTVEPNETKFHLASFAELRDIIVYRENWDTLFQIIFQSNIHFQRRHEDVAHARNPQAHGREADPQDILDAAASLSWFANCLGQRHLDPYS